ncbi:MAG TPA: alkaline phosphatase family protein [Candidatus Korarchaeota archaeon]|nr:alkaline phosphatase family protein [Candidatus Korarchaeota archaeon]
MKRSKARLILAILVLIAIAPNVVLDAQEVEKPILVILVSIDGCRWDYLNAASTPNIDALRDKGSYVVRAVTAFPSLTQTGHASIITGAYPAQHGIVGNLYYDRSRGREFRWSPEDLNATTLLEHLSRYGFKTASVLFPMSKGANIVVTREHIPEFVAQELGPIPSDAVQRDYWILRAAILILERENPDVLLLHFKSIDALGHKYGPESLEVVNAVEHVDSLIGQLVKWIEDKGLLAHTLFFITADHGMTMIEEAVPLRAILHKAGFKSYVTYEGRISKIYLSQDDDLEELVKFLRGLEGVSEVITRDRFQEFNLPAWSDKAGDVIVVSSEGRMFTGTMEKLGQHGGLTEWDLRIPLILSGPGVPASKAVREASVVDIVPTICHLLGLPAPETAVGQPITEYEDPLPLEAEDRVRVAGLTLSSMEGKCDLSLAEEALEQAKANIGSGDYLSAVEAATRAIKLAKSSLRAAHAISTAEQAIEIARKEGRISGLDEAELKLSEASSAYSAGDYSRAKLLADEALNLAEKATAPEIPLLRGKSLMLVVVVMVVVGGISYTYYSKKSREKKR